MITDLQAPETL